MISGLEEYGLRCALQLARCFKTMPHISASTIAEKEGLSIEYVRKFMYLFRQQRLVKTVRGIQGGFALTKNPAEITLKEIFDCLKKKKQAPKTFCKHFSGQLSHCIHLGECSVRPVWALLLAYTDHLFQTITLQDLLQQEELVHQTLHERWQNVAEVINHKPYQKRIGV